MVQDKTGAMATQSDDQDHAFPSEIEQEIFESAALAHPESIPTFILVARRVHTWIEPFLYRIISLHYPHTRCNAPLTKQVFLELLPLKPSGFFHERVRRVALAKASHEDTILILSACTGTTDLVLFPRPITISLLPILTNLPLRRLSANLKFLFSDGADFTHALFSRLTHLDILETPISESWITDLAGLPCLTHLSFNIPLFWSAGDLTAVLFRGLLASCPRLEALILLLWSRSVDQIDTTPYKHFADNPRSVLMSVTGHLEDWELGAAGGEDYWDRADRLIRQRRSGEIAASVWHNTHSAPRCYM
ncbi:hypothetical protein C8R43DRAFT_977653 [Mycena crocata]|nr:hypothetical protein C8R43DRAFT_977653 [Mycena crocata]